MIDKAPIYLEIYESYKRLIVLGVLKAEDRLPSIRELATEKGINPNTVGRAYALLESEGLIASIPQKGFFVQSRNLDKKLVIKTAKAALHLIKKSGLSADKLIQLVSEVYEEKK